MRRARVSKTFLDQLHVLLEQGFPRFGAAVGAEKRNRVFDVIERHLVHFPAGKMPDPDLGLTVYPVSKTPFVLLYDFDDAELRVHFILHANAERSQVDANAVEW